MKKLPILLILAGGAGKRFWPMTRTKDFFPFMGTSLLEHTISLFENAGFREAVVVCNPEDVTRIVGFTFPKLAVRTVVQPEPNGMADAVSRAADSIGNNNPVLIVNAEDVVDLGFYSKLFTEAMKEFPWVVGKQVSKYFDGGYLKIDDGRVVEIVEKPGIGNEPSDRINLVFHFFPELCVFTSLFKEVKSLKDDMYEQAFSLYMKDHTVSMLAYDGSWAPLKYPWHVLDVNAMLLSQLPPKIGRNVVIKKNVILEGNVYIEDNVTIYENTKIIGPCYIGKGSIIGNNNIIRASHIGAGCVTGFNTDITRSYIGDDCWFHSNYIGDSVLESDISMGSGSVLANLRLDEQDIGLTQKNKCGAMIGSHVRIGVNVSIMPGIKIGSDSSIGAGITIAEDVPSSSFCVGNRPSYAVKKNTRRVDIESRKQFHAKI